MLKTKLDKIQPTIFLIAIACGVSLVVTPSYPSSAQQTINLNGFTFRPIAHTRTPIPNGKGGFTKFEAPIISGGNIAFVGRGEEQEGIYLFTNNTLKRVVDRNTTIPGGRSRFRYVSATVPAISQQTIVFRGKDGRPLADPNVEIGLYIYRNGKLQRLVDRKTPIPGGGNFEDVGEPVIVGNSIAFVGSNVGVLGNAPQNTTTLVAGVYLHNGTSIRPIINLQGSAKKSLPHMFSTNLFQTLRSSGTNIVFVGMGETGKYYLYSNNRLQTLPMLLKLNANPASLALSGTNVAFDSTYAIPQQPLLAYQIYIYKRGNVKKVVNTTQRLPSGSGNFQSFANLCMSGSNIVFNAAGANDQYGAYAYWNGKLIKVLAKGDKINGKTVRSAVLQNQQSFDGKTIALLVVFTDESQSIYTATRK
ncbi:hypothetical protein [Nostoc sp. MS1]|uniref:hypothetical protein n=1 Tax=Nostoc sp. MS1 TaxID=2764711 RepID=UPI001CC601BB|nr:hypothetical protein [Nostoc sp. MS1]BCL33840.1 hypothetical protein NSMS1_02870 [Nostoc sp. MS1]